MNEENYSRRWQDSDGNHPGYDAKHSPTPWKVWHGENSLDITPEGNKNHLIASVPEWSQGHYNAEFIVKAVNSFESNEKKIQEFKEINTALLGHLKRFLEFVRHGHEGFCGVCESVAKAEGCLTVVENRNKGKC